MSEFESVTPVEETAVPVTPADSAKPKPLDTSPPEQPKVPSTTEALEKAFSKQQEKADVKPAPKPAEKQAAEPKTAPKDKKPPLDDVKEAVDNHVKERAADGKFAPKAAPEPDKPDAAPAKAAPAQDTPKPEAPKSSAPAPWRSPEAKADWEKTPESVRAEVTRREREAEDGIRQYREKMEPLKPYMEMAEKGGTTVHEALAKYTEMERILREDPLRGFQTLAQNLNIDMRKLAEHVLRQSPEQQQHFQQASQLKTENEQLQARLKETEERQKQAEQEAKMRDNLSQVERFAADHPRFDELSEAIAIEIQHGYTLEEAYERADRLIPAAASTSHQPLTPAATDAHTVPPKKSSIHGAPGSGQLNGKAGAKSNDEALRKAFAAAGL